MALRDYNGGAVPTALTADINPSSVSLSIAASTNWPTGGANGEFGITLGLGTSSEEHCLVQSRSGGTLTLASAGKRGIDGTAAATWLAGTTVHHTSLGIDFDEANAHVNDTTQDHHTQYMRADGTRHDLTARHAFGAALGTPGTPSTLAIGGTAQQGAGTVAARDTHVHAMPSSGVPVAIGGALSAGSGGAVALSNHVHTIPNNHITNALLAAPAITSADRIQDAVITLAKFAPEAATVYVPTWGGLAAGDSVFYGRYWQLGRIVVGFAGFCLNTTGNVTGSITFSLPQTGADLTGNIGLFGNTGGLVAARAFTGASGRFSGLGIMSTTTASNIATAGAGIWDGTTPVNWAPPDIFQGFFLYMAA